MASTLLAFALMLCLSHFFVNAKSVPVKQVCEYLWPGSHSRIVAPREGNGGYIIQSDVLSKLNGKYIAGNRYNVDLIGLTSSYEGFIVQARDRWNKDLILGSFTPLDTTKAHTIRCLGNEHGTVTHKTKDPVTIQSFIWQAPPTLEGSGEVDFLYSVMQSPLQYWVRMNASSVYGHEQAKSNSVPPMDAPCPPAPSPSAVYRFTATIPPNCTANCDYFLGIRNNDVDPTYLDFVLEGSVTGWVAIGFTKTGTMEAADVLGCIVHLASSVVSIVDDWNIAGGHDDVRDDIQNVCPHSASYSSGRLQCTFSRQIVTNDTVQDVPMNGNYYFLYGRGDIPFFGTSPVLTYHTPLMIPPISSVMMTPANVSTVEYK